MARPRLKIDPKLIEGMASVGATNTDIAEFAGCSVDTLTRRFADILTKSRAGMRVRLRQLQWKAAAAGDRTMLVWLGKQELGQKDRSDVTSDDRPVSSGVLAVPVAANSAQWAAGAAAQQAALVARPAHIPETEQ